MSIKLKILQAKILGKLVSCHWDLSQTITPSVPSWIFIFVLQNRYQMILGVDFCCSYKKYVRMLDMTGPYAVACTSAIHSTESVSTSVSDYIGTVGILGKLHSHRVTGQVCHRWFQYLHHCSPKEWAGERMLTTSNESTLWLLSGGIGFHHTQMCQKTTKKWDILFH